MATAYGTLFNGLRYDAKTTDFHVGEVVSGGTSAATATISDVINAGSTAGILVFSGPATGSFQDNEALLVDTLVAVAKNFVPDAIKYDAKVGNINNGDVVTGATSGRRRHGYRHWCFDSDYRIACTERADRCLYSG